MNNPLWGTRREVVLSVALVAFASAAIAAAQWRTHGAAPAAEPLIIEETKKIFGRGGDVQLGAAAAPLFTAEVGSGTELVAAGGEIVLAGAIFGGDGNANYRSASYSAGGAGFTFGAGGSGSKPRRSSNGGGSGVGGGFGFGGGGGAWGGVSGSAARSTTAPASPRAAAVRAEKAPAPKLGRQASNSGAPSVGFSSSAPGPDTGAPLGLTPNGNPNVVVPVSGLVGDPAPRGPGSAPTPEPMTLLLVGIGAAALYGARRHFV
jgi:hypothetical protein